MDKTIIKNHIYNDTISQARAFVQSINDEESLFVYAYNYNWDNGFDVPTAILQNKCCSLSIALMIFHSCDGILYLQDKESDAGTKAWQSFISSLYKRILNSEFNSGNTAFNPQLSKVSEYRLRKRLNENEIVFITPITGNDYYINL
ncbi:MAG: DUF4274 domain-containing protein [Eubacterium sp.]|nr:DUF4274 domain-containing protein [Eubacterium sp.]